MLVTPLPGTGRDNLLRTLREIHSAVFNLRGGGRPGPAQGRLTEYLEWATLAVQQLGNQITAADLERLVLTRGYERLLSGVGSMTGLDVDTQRVLNGLLSLELTQRVDAFDDAIKALDAQIKRWSRPGTFVVADTSVYIEHEDKLEDLDFARLLKIWEDPVHVLVPIVVVDELDALKRSKTNYERWRAGYTLAVLDRVFASSTGPARLRAEDFSALGSGGIPRGEVTIELVFDPPGHVRLPINDDEIIDRALVIQPLAGREVTLLTYDTGQSTRARAAGLRVHKLTRPIGDESTRQHLRAGHSSS
jgi:hypothetical protein